MSTDALIDDEEDDDLAPLVPRRRFYEEPELDITSMIDMTFLLLIFFLVTSVPDVQKALDLPPARHGVGVDHRATLVVTIADGGMGEPAIYLADGRFGAPLGGTHEAQESALRDAVQQAVVTGKTGVLIKAERGVAYRHVARVAAAASQVSGVKVNLAVMEID